MCKIKRITAVLLCVLMALPMCSCQKKDEKKYAVYYLNNDKNELVEKRITIDSTEPQVIADTLISKMEKPKKSKDKIVKPVDVNTPKVVIDGVYAYCYFDNTYNNLSKQREILYRAAIVKELAQIEGVNYVKFYMDGKDIINSDGTIMPVMSLDTFADDSKSSISDVEWATVLFYYTNKSGDSLVTSRQKICFNKNISVEKAVLETLISGALESGCYQTVPSNVKLLSVSRVDGVCYVNLSSEFLTELVNAKSQVTIYSIVNTLCGIKGIEGVKILVNGNSNVLYRDTISLDTVFVPKKDLVEK